MTKRIDYTSKDLIATITLLPVEGNNKIDRDAGVQLEEAWKKFNASDDRVAILRGPEGGDFCTGVDLQEALERKQRPGEVMDKPETWRFTPNCGIPVDKPIIAAVEKQCVAVGIGLVKMCDLCVASSDAIFWYREPIIGFTGGLMSALAERIPHKLAMELMLLGRKLTAERVCQMGLVNEVVPPEKLTEVAMQYAQEVRNGSPTVTSSLTMLVRDVLTAPAVAAARTRYRLNELAQNKDALEGITAYLSGEPTPFWRKK